MVTVRILNATGHTTLELSREEVIEQIDTHPTHWVFVNGELVSRAEVQTVNWDDAESVDLVPAIVGGFY